MWLIGLFIASIGLPFFALSANGPLLQAWFARTDHPDAKDPYFLYVASNIGSFLALVSYPLAIEPLVRLGDQARLWSAGFYVLIALIAGCGVLLWRSADQPPSAAAEGAAEAAPPTWRDAATWVTLAAVPSGLLVAVTAHISTDVAAVPLLWVLPLALYLLTFVIVFQRRPIIPHWLVVDVQPIFLLGLIAVTFFTPFETIVWIIALHLVVFFVSVLMCHGELARRRPAPKYLTGFYLWMAAGGVIGGIAAALVAPRLFNWVAEYPILLALTVLCRPGLALPSDRRNRYLLLGASAAAVLALILLARYPDAIEDKLFQTAIGALLVASVLFWQHPLPFAVIVAFVLIANHVAYDQSIMMLRSFFGVHKITETSDGRFRLLTHGTTLHGGQRIYSDDGQPVDGRPEPLLYYYDHSAIAQAIDAVRSRVGGPIRYAVIGLGSGSLACRAEPADTVHYYEIDPASIRIARDPKLFTFLSECGSNLQITLGDARLTLADAGRCLRPRHRRCLLLRRDPHPSAHARSDGNLSRQGRRARHGGDARVEPAPRACLGGRRHRRRERPDDPRQRHRRPRRDTRTNSPGRLPPWRRATRISARSRRATTGCSRNRIRLNGYGPTITPISSAP